VYRVDVEVWPTNVVLEAGETLVFEVAGHDAQGVSSFPHQHSEGGKLEIIDSFNVLHVGSEDSWFLFLIILETS
jgi:hypothetical protein